MSDAYTIEYGDTPQQRFQPQQYQPAGPVYQVASRNRFAFPGILKTAAIFLTGAVTLFSWETCAPEGYRISTFMGTYDARIAAAVKAAELEQQIGFDRVTVQFKIAADQQAEQYRAVTQGILQNYTASYELNKISTQAAFDYQNRYATAVTNLKLQEQGSDVGIINLTRGWGRILNGLQPGAGDSALDYAKNLSGTLRDEVTETATTAASTPVVNWQQKIASPAEVAAMLGSIKPLQVPVPPTIGERRTTIGAPDRVR